jgi:hypothetical protein
MKHVVVVGFLSLERRRLAHVTDPKYEVLKGQAEHVARGVEGGWNASRERWIGPNELTVIIAGMGPQLARATAMSTLGQLIHRSSSESLSQNTPQAVFVVGLCGGLTESLSASRIVTYTKCLSTEPNSEPLNCSRSITGRLGL